MKKISILILSSVLIAGLITAIFVISKLPSTPETKPSENQLGCNLVEKANFTIIKTVKACVYFDNNLDLGFSGLDSESKTGLNNKVRELSQIYLARHPGFNYDNLYYKSFEDNGQKSILVGIKEDYYFNGRYQKNSNNQKTVCVIKQNYNLVNESSKGIWNSSEYDPANNEKIRLIQNTKCPS